VSRALRALRGEDHIGVVLTGLMLVTGSIVGYAYSMEFFISWFSQNPYEQFTFINRAFGPYWWAYWTMISCNVLSPQVQLAILLFSLVF
jgi:hypothetical protein